MSGDYIRWEEITNLEKELMPYAKAANFYRLTSCYSSFPNYGTEEFPQRDLMDAFVRLFVKAMEVAGEELSFYGVSAWVRRWKSSGRYPSGEHGLFPHYVRANHADWIAKALLRKDIVFPPGAYIAAMPYLADEGWEKKILKILKRPSIYSKSCMTPVYVEGAKFVIGPYPGALEKLLRDENKLCENAAMDAAWAIAGERVDIFSSVLMHWRPLIHQNRYVAGIKTMVEKEGIRYLKYHLNDPGLGAEVYDVGLGLLSEYGEKDAIMWLLKKGRMPLGAHEKALELFGSGAGRNRVAYNRAMAKFKRGPTQVPTRPPLRNKAKWKP